MKIALNALSIGFTDGAQRSGTSRYAENLLRALSRLDKKNEYLTLLHPAEKNHPLDLGDNFQRVHATWNTSSATARVLWENSFANYPVKRFHPDLYHGFLNALPYFLPCPTVVTIHDLAPFRVPEAYRVSRRWYQQHAIRRSVRASSLVLTPTQAIREEVIQRFHLPAEKTMATGEGVADFFSPLSPSAVEEWREKMGVPPRFFLFVGNLEPRKNLLALLEVFSAWRKRSSHKIPLVVIGAKAWKYAPILECVQRRQLQQAVVLAGYVPDSQLPYWYQAALAFIYPSQYEGFGLPPLEAMACGCPVVVSRDPALVEVGGDAVLAIDPRDSERFLTTLENLASDPLLREQLRQKGIQRAQDFSWEKAARKTLEGYSRLNSHSLRADC